MLVAGRSSVVQAANRSYRSNHLIAKVGSSRTKNKFSINLKNELNSILEQVPNAWAGRAKQSTRHCMPWVSSTSNPELIEMNILHSTKKTSSDVIHFIYLNSYLLIINSTPLSTSSFCIFLFCRFRFGLTAAFLHNFDKQSLTNTTYEYEYDYVSIMHYGTHFFR